MTTAAAHPNGAGPPSPAPPILINGEEVTLERVSARKASRALAELRAITKAVPALQSKVAAFRLEYERENVVELDRAQAALRYPPRPYRLETGELARDQAGEIVMLPSPLEQMTDEDWAKADNVLRVPESPSPQELVLAIFDDALEQAEHHVYRLLALFLVSNDDVTRWWKEEQGDGFSKRLDARADELLDTAYGDELIELAVGVGELLDRDFVRKTKALGDRLGKLGRLIGVEVPTTTASTSGDGPSSSTPTLSTVSPAPTAAGAPTPSSSSPSSSPASSSPESPETASSPSSRPESSAPPAPAEEPAPA